MWLDAKDHNDGDDEIGQWPLRYIKVEMGYVICAWLGGAMSIAPLLGEFLCVRVLVMDKGKSVQCLRQLGVHGNGMARGVPY